MKHAKPQTEPSSMRKIALAFVVIAFVLLVLPLAGMPFSNSGGTEDAEKREEAVLPALLVDGRPNLGFFSGLDAWYNDHFAFRAQLVDANASLREALFMESSVGNVIVGSDGWLYYQGTMADYQRTAPMTNRALDNAACNIALMQENAERLGLGFVFTIAPNKNSLYPEHMPYFEAAGAGPSNAERIEPFLESYGVNYLNLFDVLEAEDRELYLHGDSHWTNEGALIAARSLAEYLGHDLGVYEEAAPETDLHVGDLAEMLHPLSAEAEEQPLWPQSLEYSYTNDATSVEDGSIECASTRPEATGRLVCYRDSFGNALLPYLASAYGTSSFSKMVPYDMHPALLVGADDVVVERAERHLSFFATTPPYMPAPERQLDGSLSSAATSTTCFTEQNGPYLVVEGTLDAGCVGIGDRVYVMLSDDTVSRCFEAFRISA
ncbi:MAG: hypothetical protein Q4D39_08210, partial [Coriobacteriaceae bacterium]|nr:hypothetical protein [Coriobacteriaceae bacterium]